MRAHYLFVLAAALALPLAAAAQTPAAVAANPSQDKDGRMRVQLSAVRQTLLSAEVAARIASLPLKEGDAFKAGQVIAAFDCALFRAQLAKAAASAESARQTLKVNRRLAELGSISTLEVDQALGKLKESEAETAAMSVTVSKCTITAPYAGRIAKLHVEPFQFVQPGKPLAEILDSQNLEVKLIVPSKWLAWLSKDTRFDIHVDELNRDFKARVTRLGARIDPVSQSVALAGEVDGTHAELLSGMSGWASFTPPAK
ncbi:MAG: efflux RND transporter periplasmic adaptor subunit [Rhodocyclaceae bacterium]|nr:efflux RND transporter periplasmic adaptor subunit [Rhodocyclaceae bacterium]MBX3669799.1 efflux RND transporter periplasmic adaptor subunit [Rhodocyclaceae bacterium]